MTESLFEEEVTAEETTAETESIETENAEDAIEVAFSEATADGKDEDGVKMAMIGSGATFSNVTRLYNKYNIDAGFAVSREDKNKIMDETLSGKDLSSEEGFSEAADELAAAIIGTTPKSAAALVRAYGKKNDLEVYKKPKGEGGQRKGFSNGFHEWLVQAPRTEAQFDEFIANPENSENVRRHKSHHSNIWAMAQAIHAA